MRLEFYLGRAGSGKTRRCLDEIAAGLREDPSPAGCPLILLLPEQATAQAEGDLLRCPGIRGFMRARVLSFKRLAYAVLWETGGASRDSLSDLGRQMLLRALVARHRHELRAFARSAREAGFIARLAAAFREMAQFRHSSAELEAQRGFLGEQGLGDSLLARKLHDVALLGRAWDEEMRQRFSNPDHFLDELARRIPQSRLVRGSEVWMDGFASFMPQEARVIEAILREARAVRVTLLLDPEGLRGLADTSGAAAPTRLFGQTEETYLRLRAMAVDLGAEIREPLILPAGGHPTRFSDNPVLGAFENHLRHCSMIASGGGGRSAFARRDLRPLESLPAVLPALTFVEAPNPREEVEAIARAIRRLCREEGYRYRDVAVIARDLEPWDSLIRSAFARYRIPCFMDRRRSVAHHPLVELLRSAVRAVVCDWPLEDVAHYLKTDLAPATRFEADSIENEALARGMRGRHWWLQETGLKAPSSRLGGKQGRSRHERDPASRNLAAIRRRALEPLDVLHREMLPPQTGEGIAAGHTTARRFAAALQRFLDGLKCGEIVDNWACEAREEGGLDAADEHSQVCEGIAGLLEEVSATLQDEAMPLQDLADVLDTGLSGLTLGLVPPSLDQVLVGTVERSRQPALRAVFVLGLNDRAFPAPAGEDVILSDAERLTLLEKGNFELAPPSAVRLFRERYLGYVAFTRASRQLWLSWSAADEEGRQLRASAFVQTALEAARAASRGAESAVALVRLDPGWLDSAPESVELAEQAVEGIIRARGGRAISEHERAVWGALADRLGEIPDARLRPPAHAARPAGEAALGKELAEEIASPATVLTASRLETYAECPFRYFAQYMLSLREREKFQIRPLEIGTFQHDILQEVFWILLRRFGRKPDRIVPGVIADKLLDWGEVPEEDALSALREAAERCREDSLANGPLKDNQAEFLVQRSCRHLETALRSFIRQGAEDSFAQAGAELAFGSPGAPLGPLRIESGGEASLLLSGVIDRVDLAWGPGGESYVRILDFKSSDKELDLNALAAGLSLQLPLYLSAVLAAGQGSLRAAGAFYLPVRKRIEDRSAPPEDTEEQTAPQTILARGVVDGGALDLFGCLEPGTASPYIKVTRKKDGGISNPDRSDWVPAGVLDRVCRRACAEAVRLAREIRLCHIAVSPCSAGKGKQLVCAYCDFGDVCRIGLETTRPRRIPSRKRSQIIGDIESSERQDAPAVRTHLEKPLGWTTRIDTD